MVPLPFLDRRSEFARIERALVGGAALICLYGRRRLGKSTLIRRLLRGRPAAYYVGDDRDAPLQRTDLAREIARLLPGFDAVTYPGWSELFERWRREAPARAVLALDELPAIVAASPELPSLLQKHVDGRPPGTLVIAGSSQRMMQGLLLSAEAPLYGRATEIVKLEPLGPGWIRRALGLRSAVAALESYALWGGVPRYWELVRGHRGLWDAVRDLVLDPHGVLHDEPERLLLDDTRDVTRAASLLALVGRGCHRPSELASRLGVPATSLSRPLERLLGLGLLRRDVPFGKTPRDAKHALYRVGDPLLAFHYRFVEPARSRLQAGQAQEVLASVRTAWPAYLGGAWEILARQGLARLEVGGRRWEPGVSWWGRGEDGEPLELDVVARATDDPDTVLVGEAKLSCRPAEVEARLAGLRARADRCPPLRGKRIVPVLFVFRPGRRGRGVVTAREVERAWK